ncbi:MAG: hypothetical protein WDW38_010663 [Sanguina aurantia]
MPLDTRTIGVSFGINFGIGTLCMTVFALLTFFKRFKRFYAPCKYDASLSPTRRPPPMSPSWLMWPLWLWQVKESDIIRSAGTDVAMYLKVLALGERLFLILCLVCMPLVLPTNSVVSWSCRRGGEVDRLMDEQIANGTDYERWHSTNTTNMRREVKRPTQQLQRLTQRKPDAGDAFTSRGKTRASQTCYGHWIVSQQCTEIQ